MSPATATAAARTATARRAGVPLRAPAAQPAARRAAPLRLVPTRHSSAAKAPFVIVVVTLLVSGLLGLLLLNMTVQQGSFELHELAKQGRALDQREQELAARVHRLQDPGALAAKAAALGMVPGGAPAFLQLPSGKVLGKPTAGEPTAGKPTAAKPTAAKRTTAKPATSKPATSKPTAGEHTASTSAPRPTPAPGGQP